MRTALLAVILTLGSRMACAQSATIVVSHDDPDGLVTPGQTVRIKYRLSWTPDTVLSGLWGGAVVAPDRGFAANPATAFNNGNPSALVFAGTPAGGGIAGYRAANGLTFLITPGFNQSSGIDMLWYDWTAPGPADAGPYSFAFVFESQTPSVYLFIPFNGIHPGVPVPTTVVPASLVVTPTPPTVIVFAVAGGTLTRRRRRP